MNQVYLTHTLASRQQSRCLGHCDVQRVRIAERRLWVACALLLAVTNFSGCGSCKNWAHNGFKVGPDYCKPAAPIADNWIDFNDPRVISAPANDREWWKVFNDPILDSLVQTTYQGNLPLRSQGQRVLEYRAARAIAAGGLWPQSQTLDGFYKHVQISRAGNIAGVPFPSRVFDLWNVGPAATVGTGCMGPLQTRD